MNRDRREKITEYAAGFFALIYFAAVFLSLASGDYLLPLLGFVSFVLFMLTFSKFEKIRFEPPAPPPKPESTAADRRRIKKEAEEKTIKVKEFREFIDRLAASKNIAIEFAHREGTGHMDFPEQWRIEKPIPLAPEELYRLTFYQNFATIGIVPHDDGVIYIHKLYFEDGKRIQYGV